jgi:hypothetical protein
MAVPSPLVRKAVRARVYQNNPDYSEIFMTAGQVFVSFPRNPPWSPAQTGWLCLSQYVSTRFLFINLYDFDDFRLIFQHELYCDFMQ